MKEPLLGNGSLVQHSELGKGIVKTVKEFTYTVYFFGKGEIAIPKSLEGLEIIEPVPSGEDLVNLKDIEHAIARILIKWGDFSENVPLGEIWTGGKLILVPGREGIKAKEIPIETFFHKIVMIRDRLRVLEQHINRHEKLSDEDKLDLQQYVTRIYGSLTSFNLLFKRKEDWFRGSTNT